MPYYEFLVKLYHKAAGWDEPEYKVVKSMDHFVELESYIHQEYTKARHP